jgi:hypothetical protein
MNPQAEFKVVLFFRGIDKGAEKLEWAVVIRQLVASRSFVEHLLQHLIPVELA